VAALAATVAVPTLREELDRKVFETIDFLVGAASRGRMTREQVAASLDTLFMAVAGLVDRDFVNIITAAQQTVGLLRQPTAKRYFALPDTDTVRVVSWVPGFARLTFCKYESGHATDSEVREFDSASAAAQAFERVGAIFEKKGWVAM